MAGVVHSTFRVILSHLDSGALQPHSQSWCAIPFCLPFWWPQSNHFAFIRQQRVEVHPSKWILIVLTTACINIRSTDDILNHAGIKLLQRATQTVLIVFVITIGKYIPWEG